VLSGIDGVLLVVVIGDGKLVVPVDFAIRWPDPTGPGAPCRDKLHWAQVIMDTPVATLRKRGIALPPPILVADSWCGDSKLVRRIATMHQGTFLVGCPPLVSIGRTHQSIVVYAMIVPPSQESTPDVLAVRHGAFIQAQTEKDLRHDRERPAGDYSMRAV
jgi:hypothetical protein